MVVLFTHDPVPGSVRPAPQRPRGRRRRRLGVLGLVLVNADGEKPTARLRFVPGASERARVGSSVGFVAVGVAVTPALRTGSELSTQSAANTRQNGALVSWSYGQHESAQNCEMYKYDSCVHG